MPTIGFVTSKPEVLERYFPTANEPDIVPQELPFTPDDSLLVNALRQKGHTVKPVVWGTDVNTITGFDLLVIRSPWDYMTTEANYTAFLSWLEALAQKGQAIENPVPVVRWLLDKHYLQDFERAGIPIVPSRFVEQGESFSLTDQLANHGPVVVKPCVSAAGVDLFWVSEASQLAEAQARFDTLIQRKALIVQPLLPEIETHGEWSLVFIDGHYAHAVHKTPKSGSILVHAEKGGRLRFTDAPEALQQFGRQVLTSFTEACHLAQVPVTQVPLYLRVDIIETAHGPALSECEGVEPELFVRSREASIDQFCQAVEGRLERLLVGASA